jgi:hypothetical protein
MNDVFILRENFKKIKIINRFIIKTFDKANQKISIFQYHVLLYAFKIKAIWKQKSSIRQ